jgi:hypothetical protein
MAGMENDPDIRDILLKMLELQQKQYELSVENSSRNLEMLARLRRMRMAFVVFMVVFLGAVVLFLRR